MSKVENEIIEQIIPDATQWISGNVPVGNECALMTAWSKDAAAQYTEQGQLIPNSPSDSKVGG